MFQRTLRSWGRWVRGQPSAKTDVEEERRVWLRYPCYLETTLLPANAAQAERVSGRVLDISLGGIGLLVSRPFEPGSLLSVDLPGRDEQPASTLLAYVVRVASRPNGEWSVGCTFATELGDEDLQRFGARRQKAPESDQRTWVRFPCDAQAVIQPIRSDKPQPLTARVLNIAPNGVGLLASVPFDVGSLLSVELYGSHGQPPVTMMASVVRVTTRAANEWALGCNFIRELNDKELQGLL